MAERAIAPRVHHRGAWTNQHEEKGSDSFTD
jgi:hypothetical protein